MSLINVKENIFLILLFCVFAQNIEAQVFSTIWSNIINEKELFVSDSTVHTIPEVPILAKKSLVNFSISPSITDGSINSFKQKSAINVKSYYNGGLATLSYRGTNAQQSNIVWNGININSPFLGLFDLSLLNVSTPNTQIKLTNKAIGQNFLLDDAQLSLDNTTLSIEQQIANFGKYSLVFWGQQKVETRFGEVEHTFNLSQRKAENNFEYILNDDSLQLKNAHYNFKDYNYTLNFKHHKNYSIQLRSWWQDYKRAIPFASPNAYQNDFNGRNLLSIITNLPNQIEHKLTLAYFRETIEYNNDFSWLNAFVIQSNADKQLNKNIWLSTQIQHRLNTAFTPYYQTNKRQHLTSFKVENKNIFQNSTLHILLEQQMNNKKLYLPNFMLKYKNQSVLKNVNFILSTAHFTRIPTLNDMYWQPLGNPNLKAENSIKNELECIYEAKKNLKKSFDYNFGNSFFHNYILNYIQWRPQNSPEFGSAWAPENLKRVRIIGVEPHLNLKYQWKQFIFSNYLSATYINAKNLYSDIENDASIGKQLMYVPYWKMNVNAFIKFKNTQFDYFLNYQSKQFTNTSNTQQTNAFLLLDIAVNQTIMVKKIHTTLTFAFEINNVLNTNYQLYANRPMPWRNYSFTTKISLNAKN